MRVLTSTLASYSVGTKVGCRGGDGEKYAARTNNKLQTGAPSTPTLAPDPGFDPNPNPSPNISTLTPAAALNPSLRPGFDRITRTFCCDCRRQPPHGFG